MKAKYLLILAASIVLIPNTAGSAPGGWTVTYLQPPGAGYTEVNDVSGGQ